MLKNASLNYGEITAPPHKNTHSSLVNKIYCKEILNLWKLKKNNALNKTYKQDLLNLTAKDPIQIFLKEKIDEINLKLQEYFPDGGKFVKDDPDSLNGTRHNVFYKIEHCATTSETDMAVDQLYERLCKDQAYLNEKHNEILTMITPCENYSQALNILKAYNIVDSQGRLYSS